MYNGTLESSLAVSYNVKHRPILWFINYFLGIYPEIRKHMYTKRFYKNVVTALFITQDWKHQKCPLIEKWKIICGIFTRWKVISNKTNDTCNIWETKKGDQYKRIYTVWPIFIDTRTGKTDLWWEIWATVTRKKCDLTRGRHRRTFKDDRNILYL